MLVDEHPGRGVTAQEQPIGFLLEVGRGRARSACPRAGRARRPVVLDREPHQRPAGRDLLRIDLVRPIHRLEQPVLLPHRLGRPQDQESRYVERVMEGRQHPLLQRRGHVDQDIAATDEIHMRERRIGGQVLASEDAAIADRFVDAVELVFLLEEAVQPLGRELGLDARGIAPGAGPLQRAGIAEIGGEDLERAAQGLIVEKLPERDGQ